jgi:hypothetical protein
MTRINSRAVVFSVLLAAICLPASHKAAGQPYTAPPCQATMTRAPDGLVVWSPDATRYINLQQLTHFNSPAYPESNAPYQGSVAASGVWRPDGASISALNLFFPIYQTWSIDFRGPCSAPIPEVQKQGGNRWSKLQEVINVQTR